MVALLRVTAGIPYNDKEAHYGCGVNHLTVDDLTPRRCSAPDFPIEGRGGATNRSLLILAGDIEQNPGPVWVQYSLHFKGENNRVGEALMKLEDQWQEVPEEALANWLKRILMAELANTLVRTDAVLVNLEMPVGTPVSNDSIHECLSREFVNVAVVAPRPTVSAVPVTQTQHFTPPSGQHDVVIEAGAFNRGWAPPTHIPLAPAFTSPPSGFEGAAYSTSGGHPITLRLTNGPAKSTSGGAGFGVGDKRKRQEKWTEHETLVLVAAKQQEEEDHATAADADRLKTAGERWNRTAQLMQSKGVMDREGKNCEDKITNLKKDWGKIKDWNMSHGGIARFWELSITDRKLNKLPVNMSEAVYNALDEMEDHRLRRRHAIRSPQTDASLQRPEATVEDRGFEDEANPLT